MRKLMLFVLIMPFLLLTAGCSMMGDNDPSAANNDDENLQSLDSQDDVYVLVEGENLALSDYNATLTFVERKEDSRCPKNVDCVWEGRVKIMLTFTLNGQATSFEMVGFVGPDGYEAGSPPQVTYETRGFRFVLERLDPYPVDGLEQTNTPSATIRVDKI